MTPWCFSPTSPRTPGPGGGHQGAASWVLPGLGVLGAHSVKYVTSAELDGTRLSRELRGWCQKEGRRIFPIPSSERPDLLPGAPGTVSGRCPHAQEAREAHTNSDRILCSISPCPAFHLKFVPSAFLGQLEWGEERVTRCLHGGLLGVLWGGDLG